MVDAVDWEDPALKRWLGTIARESTKYIYRSSFKAYALFSGMRTRKCGFMEIYKEMRE
jgi:hypothetical protein